MFRPLPLLILATALVACTGSPPIPEPESWTTFPDQASIEGFETRFRQQPAFTPSPADEAHLRASCPTIQRGRADKDSASFYLVQLEGEGLGPAVRVGALLADGSLADARTRMQGETLQIPVACEACTLIFGVALPDGRYAACTGPGHSLRLQEGQLISP